MHSARWQRMWQLFHEVVELPPEQREMFLDGLSDDDRPLRVDLEQLLAAHGSEAGLPAAATAGMVRPIEEDAEVLLGSQLGPYQLLEVLGQGGMGVVYRAEQSGAVNRAVAVKVIRFGMQSREVVSRFQLERQALAMMDHPGIARLFDAGVTGDGRPYFAMEEVTGLPISSYCDRHALSVGARVDLFRRVCLAVEHAHQRGVLHRDLKPSNILIADTDGGPQPKIIDFGIAKAIGQAENEGALSTVLGRAIGTPEYMSPEQASGIGGVDTRSDVYSLGVVLYELLVGAVPFSFEQTPYSELQRILREVEVPRASQRATSTTGVMAAARGTDPATLRRALSGELDWILLKALDKDPERRYGSAAEFAADLGRYLAHEPVLAGAPSRSYRAKKFVRRHRVAVGAVVAVVMALVLGLAATLWMAWVAERERGAAVLARVDAEQARDRAERETETARAVQHFLEEMIAAADPTAQHGSGEVAREVRVVDVLDGAAARLDTAFDGLPEVEAALRDTLGRTYGNLGLFREAGPQLDRALTLRTSLFGARDPRTLASAFQVAALLNRLGEFEAAEQQLRQLLDLRREVEGEDATGTLETMSLLNDVLLEQGRVAEAAVVYRDALERARRTLGPDHPVTLQSLNNLALVLNRLGDAPAAVETYRESVAEHRRVLGPDHPNTLQTLSNLGAALLASGNLAEAREVLQQAVVGYEKVLGPQHSDTLRSLNNLGAFSFKIEAWAEAEEIFRKALEGYAASLGDDHPLVLVSTANVARAVSKQGRLEEAETIYRRLIERASASLPARHPNVAIFQGGMGVCLFEMSRYAEAEDFLLASYRGHLENFGPDHPRTVQGVTRLVDLYRAWGRTTEQTRYQRLLRDRPGDSS